MIFLDTNIFMYAAGRDHPNKRPCQLLLEAVAKSGSVHQYCTNTEVLQEILHRYKSIGLPEIGFALFDGVLGLGLEILPVDLTDLILAKKILLEYPELSTRDAVHLGVVVRHDIKKIISYDKDFKSYPSVTIVKPGI